jgi:hypothetical protein
VNTLVRVNVIQKSTHLWISVMIGFAVLALCHKAEMQAWPQTSFREQASPHEYFVSGFDGDPTIRGRLGTIDNCVRSHTFFDRPIWQELAQA